MEVSVKGGSTVFLCHYSISFLLLLFPDDMTTYTIQSGDGVCSAVNGSSCRYDYYVLSNGINAGVLAVIDEPGTYEHLVSMLSLQERIRTDS